MFSTRIACKLISGRVAAKAYSLGLSAPGIRQCNSCALKGHGKYSFPPPLQGGFRVVVLNLGLKAPGYMPPLLRSEETRPLPNVPDADAHIRGTQDTTR